MDKPAVNRTIASIEAEVNEMEDAYAQCLLGNSDPRILKTIRTK